MTDYSLAILVMKENQTNVYVPQSDEQPRRQCQLDASTHVSSRDNICVILPNRSGTLHIMTWKIGSANAQGSALGELHQVVG